MPRKAKTTNQPISSVNLTTECTESIATPAGEESANNIDNVIVENTVSTETSADNDGKAEQELVSDTIQPESAIDAHFSNIFMTLTAFKSSIAALNHHIKLLEREMKRELKGFNKRVKKDEKKVNRKPSGFARPSDVSSELCDFMGRTIGTQIARTEVTQYLIQYIKENELQFPENKKVIVPDAKLKKLLGVDNETEVTYFNLQGLMNKHFVH